ncbi:membrane protein insertase YidC [Candidatus Rickettsiella viridis]|uniref:Membrane protein insertase YidC n=1 Tax=Candidatus Rickettsiella viridis TaxID=676208 RepID=A0A2Z5UXR5_9COXI|nr:membrane protein insertase YidC [Candidatus Rickettsiella viridis]BBB15920.1 membrane protein insertase YidC [Candidatus Rickettsiella viridis]
MELARVFLLGALFLIAFMLWNAWQNEYPNTQALKTPTPVVEKQVAAAMRKLPDAQIDEGQKSQGQRFVHVKTDVLDVLIDTQGGNIVQANLLSYPERANEANSPPFQLLSNSPDSYYVSQSGIVGSDKPVLQYKSAQINYNLGADQSELAVNLLCTSCGNIAIQKQFVFKRGDYQVPINYQINNHSDSLWKGQLYTQFQQKKRVSPHSLFNISSYIGGAISTQEKPYQKVSFDKMGEGIAMATENGWVAMLQHYFISAWVPPAGPYHFYSYGKDNIYTLGMLGNPFQIEPGAQYTSQAKLYLGPESLDRLKAVAPHLDLTVDYGILWFISMALFWLLKHIYQVVGNWGWSIVIVTVLIKLAFYHLSAKSYRSMAAMRNLQPRLNALKERYADDRQKLTQATMELYKAEKVNPLGGCLPILVQIPVFIALYWMLLESVELRQAPFIFWIHDLSTKDPYYILPILMGISMFVQQRLNPPPPDPTQAKVMQFLPILFTALFLNFPSGLVLYWVVNNTLSILQQWYIMRRMEQQFNQKNLKKR